MTFTQPPSSHHPTTIGPVYNLFRGSTNPGEIPGDWSGASVVDVLEEGVKSILGSFTLVSLSSVLCKEKIKLMGAYISQYLVQLSMAIPARQGHVKNALSYRPPLPLGLSHSKAE